MLEFVRDLAVAMDRVLMLCMSRVRYNLRVLDFLVQQIEKVVGVLKTASAVETHERAFDCVDGLEAALRRGKLLIEEHEKPLDLGGNFYKVPDVVEEVRGICRELRKSLEGLGVGREIGVEVDVRDELITEDKFYLEWYLRCTLEGRIGQQRVDPLVLRHLETLKTENIQHLDRMLRIKDSALALGRSIGQGQLGEVFQARWAGRTVAVKQLRIKPDSLSMVELAKFLTTAEMNVWVKHPHVVDCFAATNSGCLVMELAHGNLQQLCLESHQLSWDTKLDLMLQAARGLAHLHSKGIVHQNIKSRNFLVLGDRPASSTVKVAEFGMGRAMAPVSGASPGELLGSDPWIAPDNTLERVRDFASDVFGFGVVMYEVASQSLPYGKMRSDQMLGRKQHWGEPCSGLHRCPEGLKEVMKRCIHPHHLKRPSMESVYSSLVSIRKRLQVDASFATESKTCEFLKTSTSVPDACMERGPSRTNSYVNSDLLNSAYSVPEGIDAEELANQLSTFEIDFALEKAARGMPSYVPDARKSQSSAAWRPIGAEIPCNTSNKTSGSSASLTVTLTGTSLLTLDHSVSPKIEVSSFTRQWVKSRGAELKHMHDDDKAIRYSTTEEGSQKSRYTPSNRTSGTDEGSRKLIHGTAYDTNLQAVSAWVADTGSRRSMEERVAMLHSTAFDDSLKNSRIQAGQKSGCSRLGYNTHSDAVGQPSRLGRATHASIEARRKMLYSSAFEGNLKASRCAQRDSSCGAPESKKMTHCRDESSRTGDSHVTPYDAYDDLGEGPSSCAWKQTAHNVDTVSTLFSLAGTNLATKNTTTDNQYTVKWILEQELQLSRRSSDRTLLHNAAISGNLELTEAIVAGSVDIDKIDKYGRTALHDAAQWGRTTVAELLLQNNANPTIQDIGGETPLHLAACGSSICMVKLLLAHVVDKRDIKNHYGNTPLHIAAMRGNLEVLKILLEHGSDPKTRNNNRKRPQDLGDAFVKEVFRAYYSDHAPPKKVGSKKGIKQLFIRGGGAEA